MLQRFTFDPRLKIPPGSFVRKVDFLFMRFYPGLYSVKRYESIAAMTFVPISRGKRDIGNLEEVKIFQGRGKIIDSV